jgi:hypothetical protein
MMMMESGHGCSPLVVFDLDCTRHFFNHFASSMTFMCSLCSSVAASMCCLNDAFAMHAGAARFVATVDAADAVNILVYYH